MLIHSIALCVYVASYRSLLKPSKWSCLQGWQHLQRQPQLLAGPGRLQQEELLRPQEKDHRNISILHSGSEAQDKENSRNIACSILVFMWSLGPF